MPDYSPEQLWPLYEKLPEDLKEAIFSEKTAETIYDVCTRNGLEEEKISQVAKFTGHVLLGILSPEDFQNTLEEEVNLKRYLAQKISEEINRFVFYPVKSSLEGLYKMKITPPVEPSVKTWETLTPKDVQPKEAQPVEEKPATPPARDIYREPIE